MFRGASSRAIGPLLLLKSEQFPPSCMAGKVWDAPRMKMGFLYRVPLLQANPQTQQYEGLLQIMPFSTLTQGVGSCVMILRQQFDLSIQYSLPNNASSCPHASLSFVSSRGLGMGKLSAVTPREQNYFQWRILLPGSKVVLFACEGSRTLLS